MIRLLLPIRTSNPLNNSQGTTMRGMYARSRERKQQRSVTALAVRAALACDPMALPLVITLTRIAPSNGLDCDSLPASMKALRDAVTDALGLSNDRDERLTWQYAQRRGAQGQYQVEVRIESRTTEEA